MYSEKKQLTIKSEEIIRLNGVVSQLQSIILQKETG